MAHKPVLGSNGLADGFLVAGMDEAGRGPAIGPLVIAVAVIEKSSEDRLLEMGVKDSKLLSPSVRERLAVELPRVLSEFAVFSFEPAELDALMVRESLNEIEAMGCARLLNGLSLDPKLVLVDSPDTDAKRFGLRIGAYLSKARVVRSEHKADFKYPVVGAASILAKVARDQAVAELGKIHGDFGSGYPSDPRTRAFLEKWVAKHGDLPVFARRQWAGNQALINKKSQRSLGEFG